MRHLLFEEAADGKYSVAVLSKDIAFDKYALRKYYVDSLNQQGLPDNEIIAFTLDYNENGKAPVKFIKEYLAGLLPKLGALGVSTLYVADAAYFKTLAGKVKTEPCHGYVFPCKIKGYEHISIVLGTNYQALVYNPILIDKLNMGIRTVAEHVAGTHQILGEGIIHSSHYPENTAAITQAVEDLHQYPSLTCDIETASLKFHEAGIATISFAWDKNNGIAFPVDYVSYPTPEKIEGKIHYGHKQDNPEVKAVLRNFFETYKGELTFHNVTYDVKILIYELWMKHPGDTEGLLTGLHLMCERMHDTKIIAYLATNTTAGNVLGLKALAHEFAGDYAKEDIKDIRRIPLPELLEYNLIDALSTHYVREKYEPIMEQDNQGELYRGLMLDSLKVLIQVELTGMPMSRKRIQEVKTKLVAIEVSQFDTIVTHPVIKTFNLIIQNAAMTAANAKLTVKQHPLSKFDNVTFNPNSGPQLQKLLYEWMCLPVLDYTKTKLPATGADTISKLINHTDKPAYKELLTALIKHGKVSKILTTFIPAFEKAISRDASDTVWLHGSFNLGGTVSGRLSSSQPNLQQIPSNSEYAKIIKSCFIAPRGQLFCGADFNSLEDYISALTTKDPNKLKVYLDGFDGHSLRAANYFREQCPEIDLTDPVSVNSIIKKYPQLRQDSKVPTFALTYQGTFHTLMKNLGFSEEKAKRIEKEYHDLYVVSDQYIQTRLEQASKEGYVDVAFGLRVRTPLLAQVVFNAPKMPHAASSEGRTAGNALGQSYGLLNNRAVIDFMKKVWASPYRLDIHPTALIHDSIYLTIEDDAEIVEWVNRELIKSMQWQELPELQHDTVKLGANLMICFPSWAETFDLPNGANKIKIRELAKAHRTCEGIQFIN